MRRLRKVRLSTKWETLLLAVLAFSQTYCVIAEEKTAQELLQHNKEVLSFKVNASELAQGWTNRFIEMSERMFDAADRARITVGKANKWKKPALQSWRAAKYGRLIDYPDSRSLIVFVVSPPVESPDGVPTYWQSEMDFYRAFQQSFEALEVPKRTAGVDEPTIKSAGLEEPENRRAIYEELKGIIDDLSPEAAALESVTKSIRDGVDAPTQRGGLGRGFFEYKSHVGRFYVNGMVQPPSPHHKPWSPKWPNPIRDKFEFFEFLPPFWTARNAVGALPAGNGFVGANSVLVAIVSTHKPAIQRVRRDTVKAVVEEAGILKDVSDIQSIAEEIGNLSDLYDTWFKKDNSLKAMKSVEMLSVDKLEAVEIPMYARLFLLDHDKVKPPATVHIDLGTVPTSPTRFEFRNSTVHRFRLKVGGVGTYVDSDAGVSGLAGLNITAPRDYDTFAPEKVDLSERLGLLVGVELSEDPIGHLYLGATFSLYKDLDLFVGAAFKNTDENRSIDKITDINNVSDLDDYFGGDYDEVGVSVGIIAGPGYVWGKLKDVIPFL